MPNGFFRSKKGEEMYALINKQYENTLKDDQYAEFLRRTAHSPHSARNKKVVTAMIRELGEDGNEYLRYELWDTRYDAIGAEFTEYCPHQGIYPIPVAQPRIEIGENMSTREVVSGDIIRYEIGYEIPFTPEAADKIHEMVNERSRSTRTSYLVSEYKGGKRITVISYEDFRNKPFDVLFNGKVEVQGKKKEIVSAPNTVAK
jgi:hypothetical protein